MGTLPNPLHPLHQQADAEFQSYADLEITSTFGEPQAEYSAIRKAAAIMDLPQRGVLQLTGKDRLPFLNNLLTNQTWDKAAKNGMEAGQGVYAFYLNIKGRIVAELCVLELGERTLLEMDARLVDPLKMMLDRYLFTEQVQMTSLLGQSHRLAIHGPEALSVLADAAGQAIPELADLASVAVPLLGIDSVLFRDDSCSVPGYQIIVPAERAGDLWSKLLFQFSNPLELGKRRLRPVGWAAYNACRIEGGRPLFDIDFGNSADPDHSTLPAETGPLFPRGVSLTKGCYLGQEIVARMHARQQLARAIVGIRMEDEALPIAGNPIFTQGDDQIGMVTSSTVSPILSNAAIALAMVKKPYFAPGTALRVAAEGQFHKAVVVELPFIPTSPAASK